jgi:hypothetical protein
VSRYIAFNGDADGLCALQQIRLTEPGDAVLITGVKRDIALMQRVKASAGDSVTALDISLDPNREATQALLDAGVSVRYFDHHFAGERPTSQGFEAYIDESPEVCTSVLVDRYLNGRYRHWAIAAAFGDNLPSVGEGMAKSSGLDAEAVSILNQLGTYLNYNAYGESVDDLHFDPAKLAESMLPFVSPFDFVKESETFGKLRAGYESDIVNARQTKPLRQSLGATVVLLPDAAWARRVIGVYANEMLLASPQNALSILIPKTQGGYVVSVRAPAYGRMGADDFCRKYKTGGGRKLAAGINHLDTADLDRFSDDFVQSFS